MSERYTIQHTFDGFWLIIDTWTCVVVTKFVIKDNAVREARRLNEEVHAADE